MGTRDVFDWASANIGDTWGFGLVVMRILCQENLSRELEWAHSMGSSACDIFSLLANFPL